MIKDNQKYFNRIQILLDAVIIIISYVLAWFLKFKGPFMTDNPNVLALPMSTYFDALYFIVPGYLLLYNINHLYAPKRTSVRQYEFIEIVRANVVGLVGFIVVLYAIKQIHFSRAMILLFFAINVTLMTLSRFLIRSSLHYFRKKGYNLKYILLIGYSRAAEAYIDRLNANPQWGYVVRGILDDHIPAGTVYKGVKVLGTIGNLEYVLPENKLDEIAISLSLSDYSILEKIVAMCEKSGVHTKFIPDYSSLFPSNPYTEDLMGLPVINIRNVPLTSTWNWLAKRAFDVVFALLAIVISSPVMLIAVISIKLSGPGPIIYKQERIGLHNKPFMMFKFRTMVVQDETTEEKCWTTKDDPRVTRCGHWMRKTSIDELPQFFNVLRGDMSVVGPRPERPQFVEKFKEEIPRYMVKHQVRPGLTGWAQISGYRGDTSIRKRIEYDIYYIENWTFGFDMKIIFLTVFKVFRDKNAY